MDRQTFFAALRENLRGLPLADVERSIEYYEEMVSDRMEDGATEEEAIAALGSVEEITAQVLSEIPLTKLVKAKVKPSRGLKIWEIVLLILGSPVWVPLILAAVVVLLAVYFTLWAMLFSLYAMDVSLALCGIGCIVAAPMSIPSGSTATLFVVLGAGLVLAGLGIACFFGLNPLAKHVLGLSKKILLGLKSLFIRKEEAQ